MSIVGQLAVIFSIALAGEAVSALLPVAMPGSVLAMVIMFALLCLGVVREESISQVADFLVSHMAILFIPITVGVIEIYPMIRGRTLGIVLMCLATSALTFAATAGAAVLVLRLQRRGR